MESSNNLSVHGPKLLIVFILDTVSPKQSRIYLEIGSLLEQLIIELKTHIALKTKVEMAFIHCNKGEVRTIQINDLDSNLVLPQLMGTDNCQFITEAFNQAVNVIGSWKKNCKNGNIQYSRPYLLYLTNGQNLLNNDISNRIKAYTDNKGYVFRAILTQEADTLTSREIGYDIPFIKPGAFKDIFCWISGSTNIDSGNVIFSDSECKIINLMENIQRSHSPEQTLKPIEPSTSASESVGTEHIPTRFERLSVSPEIVGIIDLSMFEKKPGSKNKDITSKRERIRKTTTEKSNECPKVGGGKDLSLPKKEKSSNKKENERKRVKANEKEVNKIDVIDSPKVENTPLTKTYIPSFEQKSASVNKSSAKVKNKEKYKQQELDEVYSSIFAPAEIKKKTHLQVHIYLHLHEYAEMVKSLAKECNKNAERRDYVPLSLKLKKGDLVNVELSIYGETLLMSERKTIMWQGPFTKCSFDYFVPGNLDIEELCCVTNLSVNGALIGEMRFITQIVETPRNLIPKISSKPYKKIFISYSHKDAHFIKFIALAYKAQGVDYFFDRHSLLLGDVFDEKIFDYIDSSDLFILCWSKNAEESEYVIKEKNRALLHAYPNIKIEDATLTIRPISIEPRADLPDDIKNIYNYEEL